MPRNFPLRAKTLMFFHRNFGASDRLRRLIGFVLVGAAAVSCVQAQSGSSPVGVMSYAVAQNSTISLGVPLLRPSLVVGEVTAVNGVTLTLSANTVVPSLVSGESYFVEVVAHLDGTTSTLLGHRFEVDEVATVAASAGKIVLEANSTHNTSPAEAIAGLTGYRVAVRPHWTLAALLGTGRNAKVNAGASAGAADQVLAWNGRGFSVYYLREGDVPQWRNAATGPLNQDGAIVPPGVGVFLRRRAGSLNFSVAGEVRTNRFVRPAFAASQLVANGFPVETSPADWRLTTSAGLSAGTTPLNSDRLLTWTGSSVNTYFLSAGATPQWRSPTASLLDFSNARLFPAQGANFLLLRSAANGSSPPPLVQAVPFSL